MNDAYQAAAPAGRTDPSALHFPQPRSVSPGIGSEMNDTKLGSMLVVVATGTTALVLTSGKRSGVSDPPALAVAEAHVAPAAVRLPEREVPVVLPGVEGGAPAPASPPPPATRGIPAMVAGMVAENGIARTADTIVRLPATGRGERRAALETLTSAWGASDPVAAVGWIARNADTAAGRPAPLPPVLWDAAVGGYIEGIVETDPEAAAIAAGLLERHPASAVEPALDRPPHAGENRGLQLPVAVPGEAGAPLPEEPDQETNPALNLPDPTGAAPITTGPDPRFPGDPGFPGDPDFLIRNR